MLLRSLLSDPASLRIAVLIIAAIAVVVSYFAYRLRGDGPKVKSAPGPIVLNLEKETPHTQPDSQPVLHKPPASSHEPPAPTFPTLGAQTTLFADILRAALILLALVVAAGFILIIFPQRTVDRISHFLQSRNSPASLQERIAFLYLGDELKDDRFDIRGAVRNITTEPIEKMDAVIRLYGAGGELRETVVVRMDKETIAPDEIGQFRLAYPDYKGQFGSYSVEFKLREGEFVPYKDMRAPHTHS